MRRQSRAQSFSGSLSAVGRRLKLWDNGINIFFFIGRLYNNESPNGSLEVSSGKLRKLTKPEITEPTFRCCFGGRFEMPSRVFDVVVVVAFGNHYL